ncbi:MAG: radical SAM protein [Candidatus Omnitrophota bacterium]
MTIQIADRKESKGFLKSIRKGAAKKRNPFSVMFELTYECNFNCVHCYVRGSRKEKKELNTKEVFFVLDELKKMGVFRIGFTGGEPLLRKDIFDILDYANKCGFKKGLLTNGYLIDEEAADRLKSVNIDKVEITLNALDAQIFDKMTQVKDSFKKVKRAVELLVERGIQVKVKSTATALNKSEPVKISQYARALDIPYNLDGEIMPCRDGCDAAVNEYSLSGKETREIREKVYPEMYSGTGKRSKSKRKRDRMFNCGVGKSSFSITPYGEMNLCLEIDYPKYNILSKGAGPSWQAIKNKIDELNSISDFICKNCDLLKYCGWCAGRSYIETGSFNKCSEYFKKRAVERRELNNERKKDSKKKAPML